MKKPPENHANSQELRKRAEKRLHGNPPDDSELRPENFPDVLQELRVHQVELEIQNEELRRTRQELEESRDLYFDLYDLAPVGYLNLDQNGLITRVNLTAAAMLGKPRHELIKRGLSRFIDQKHHARFAAFRKRALEEGSDQHCELAMIRADAEPFHALLTVIPDNDAGGRLQGLRAVIVDITERKNSEAALAESEEKFRLAFENASVGVCLVSLDGHLLKANQRLCNFFGCSEQELIGRSVDQFSHRDDAELSPEFIRRSLTGEVSDAFFEKRYFHKQGHIIYGQVSSSLVRDPQGNPLYFISHVQDITGRKLVEQRQALNAQVMKYLNEASGVDALVRDILLAIKKETGLEAVGIRLKDGEDYPYYTTNGFSDDFVESERYLCSRDDSGELIRDDQGKVCLECMCGNVIRGRTDSQLPFFTAGGSFWTNCTTDLLASTSEVDLQVRTRNRCNTEGYESVALIPLRSKGEIIGLLQLNDSHKNRFTLDQVEFFEGLGYSIGVAIDRWLAEREKSRLAEQLRQSQKMEAVGTLAGGIAHDFNNILAAMMGYTELALDDLEGTGPVVEKLCQVLIAGNRAAELVRQILHFSRIGEQEDRPLALSPLIRESLKLLRASLPATIEIQMDLPESGCQVLADPVHIHQIIMNLCTNAAQAMAEAGGVLAIELSTVNMDEDTVKTFATLKAGKYHKLTVSDNGIGMTKGVVDRVFEPFFTTKETGKGTGMGMAVVHGIVREHGGDISIYSEPGQGTTVNVYLPVLETELVTDETEIHLPVVGGTERILLVDDEKALAEIGLRALKYLGYAVTAFTSSREALERFRAGPDDFDLVITDYTMPEMTGAKLSQKILALRPDTPIIICTGFSQQLDDEKAKALGIRKLLMKPLSRGTLARAVREALDGKD
ncbi:MAG: PAS domain S-box protein [Proteobacteria bacterium]|nr:PAS domain S-box protein [Pseudomonadota bacterium]